MNFNAALQTIHTYQDLLDLGLTSGTIARKTKRQELTKLLPGVYTSQENFQNLPSYQQYPYQIAAVFKREPQTIFTHQSAAWLYGLAVTNQRLVDVYCPPASRGRPQGIRKHYSGQEPEITVLQSFLQVTSLRQTLRDCCRYLHPSDALVTLESALYQGAISSEELGQYFNQQKGYGSRKVKMLAGVMGALSESPGESKLKWLLYTSPLPMPQQQVQVYVRGQHFRLDFAYREQKVALEFDGRLKYLEVEAPREVIYEELRREKLLKNVGWEIFRYDWSTVVSRPYQIIEDVAQALQRKGVPLR